MSAAMNDGGTEGQPTTSSPHQLDLIGLPLVFDARDVYRPQIRPRPRLEDFLRQKNGEPAHGTKPFHYPFQQPMPSSPQFGAPEFEPPNVKAEASSQDEKFEQPLSISLPPLLINIRDHISRYIIEWWLLEILNWFIGAFSVAALVIVLRHYDDSKIPHWKFGLTLNALISLLAGLTKSSLLIPTYQALGQLKWNWFLVQPKLMVDFELFDSASRGPLGSIFLLFRTVGK